MGAANKPGITRRNFLRMGASAAAGAGMGLRSFTASAAVPHSKEKWEGGTVITSTCNMCVNRCGIRCRVENGVLEKIDGDPRNPLSRGGTCAKGQAGIMSVYDPDRIKYPMIRVGERGEGKWRRASWDEAFDYVAENIVRIMDQHGPESMLWSSTTDLTEQFFVRLGIHLPTPNFARHATLCLASRNVGYFGTMGGVPGDNDFAHAKYILMFGANRLEAFQLPDNITLIEGVKNGAKLVVVDPRMTYTAAKGEWVPIRPRTDMALTLALMHVLIKEELYDKEFVANLTYGFEELKAHVEQYTPEWAANETEIPAEKIVAMAREMAAAAPAVIVYPGRRSSWYTNDTQFRRTLPMLAALLGAFDTEGSNVFCQSTKLGSFEWEIEPFDVADRFDNFNTRFPLANHEDGGYVSLRNAVLDGTASYPVKGWMIYKQNPLAAVLDGNKTLMMMKQMDFICAIDVQPSETAWMADVILPETTYLERLDPVWSPLSRQRYIGIRQPVVPPQYEAKTTLEIMQGLAKALDAKHEFETPLSQVFDFTMEEFIDAQLQDLPVDRETLLREGIWLEPHEKHWGVYRSGSKAFATPTGKIEFVSERFRRNGYPVLPEYEPPVEPPGKQRLITGRHAWFTHQRHGNNLWLHDLYPENEVWINPDVAAQKGIVSGEQVLVRSGAGEVKIKALVTPKIRPDTVFIVHGFGSTSAGQHAAYGKGGADFMLMESASDQISDNQAMHETFVEVLKI